MILDLEFNKLLDNLQQNVLVISKPHLHPSFAIVVSQFCDCSTTTHLFVNYVLCSLIHVSYEYKFTVYKNIDFDT